MHCPLTVTHGSSVDHRCTSLQAAILTFITKQRTAMAAAYGLSISDVVIEKITCTSRSGAAKVFSVLRSQGGRRRRLQVHVSGNGRTLLQAPAGANELQLAIPLQFTSNAAAAAVAAIEAGPSAPNVTSLLAAAVAASFPPGSVQLRTAAVVAVVEPLPPPVPPPPPPSASPITVWADSAVSPR